MANKKLIYSFDFKKLLNEKIKQYPHGSTQRNMIYAVLQWLDKAPRIDAEPVRHGKWIVVCDTHDVTEDDYWGREWYAKCSECGRMIPLNDYICETQSPEKALTKYPYCHCGARMDEVIQ